MWYERMAAQKSFEVHIFCSIEVTDNTIKLMYFSLRRQDDRPSNSSVFHTSWGYSLK